MVEGTSARVCHVRFQIATRVLVCTVQYNKLMILYDPLRSFPATCRDATRAPLQDFGTRRIALIWSTRPVSLSWALCTAYLKMCSFYHREVVL